MEKLAEFLSGLENLDDDAKTKLTEIAQSLVDAETEKGKEHYRKKDAEAKKLRESLATREQELEAGKNEKLTIEEQMAQLESKFQEAENARIEEHNKRVHSDVKSALSDALGNIYNKELSIKGMLSDAKADIKDGVPYIGEVTVADYAKTFRESNPDALIASQTSGTGDGADSGSSQSVHWTKMSLSDAYADAQAKT